MTWDTLTQGERQAVYDAIQIELEAARDSFLGYDPDDLTLADSGRNRTTQRSWTAPGASSGPRKQPLRLASHAVATQRHVIAAARAVMPTKGKL